jgi:lipopolysaccharide biosynthesis regulator YciM
VLLAVLDRDHDRAERLLTQLVRSDSSDVELYLALARLFRMRGEVGRAIRVHQNLLLRSDLGAQHRTAALSDLGEDFRQGGFLRRAIGAYEEVLVRDPRNCGVLHRLVELLAEVRDYPRAIALSRRLARLDRGAKRAREISEAELLVRMAEAESAEGRFEEARRAVKRALKKDPRNCDAQILLGGLEAERGRNKAALAAWKTVAGIDRSKAEEVYPRLEATFAALDRARDFERYLRELLDQSPENSGARIALARALANRGAVDEGLAELRRVLDGNPGNLVARIALGRMLLAEHRDTDAVKEFGQLLVALEERDDLVRREIPR